MSVTNLHVITVHQNYLLSRDLEIKRFEDKDLLAGTDLRSLGPRPDDPANSAFIGYGIDFRENSSANIQAWYTQAGLSTFLTPADIVLLTNYQTNPTSANRQALLNSFTHLPDEPAAARLLAAAVDARETQLDTRLGFVMPESNERAALMSMLYNGGTGIIGSALTKALQDDNRAEAWYQIRYNSNNGNTRNTAGQGLANRRFKESDLFNLYGDGPLSDLEAKEVLQMYTKYRDLSLDLNGIRAYDAQFSPTNPNAGSHGIDVEISPARDHLIANFAEGRTIDGEVLVGQNEVAQGDVLEGTASGDLLFGEQGTDVLRGGAGTDVLYGGAGIDTLSGGTENDLLRGEAGNDTLQGGAGNDLLEGGAGFDTYIYKTGDGNDRIEDSDATGVIVVNGKMLTGGVKKAGQNDWISSDGTLKYLMSGTDLVVQLNGTTIMTVNEDFQSGQFGIRLIDGPVTSTEAPPTVLTIVGDFQPLDMDPVEEGVQIGYDELGNIIQDPGSPGDRSDLLNGSGNNDTLNGGALRDRLTALGGSDVLVGGSDGDVLIGQDGNDQLFGDQLVNVGSLTSFENVGGTVGTGASGDFLSSGVNDDVLVGGAGNDALYGGAGQDLVLGGAGDDVIDGDSDFVAANFEWSYTFHNPFSYTLNNAVFVSNGGIVGDDDVLYGGAGNDVMMGMKGNDFLYGEVGNDKITGDDGDDVILGGEGDDFIQGDDTTTTGNDYVDGGDGDDVVLGADGDDTVVGGAGNDILYGEAANMLGIIGHDILDGGDGNDELDGNGGNDVLHGGAGADTLLGDFLNDPVPGDDFLYGDEGNDMLRGGAGDDVLDGGDGDDELQGNQGSDVLSGGAGVDTMFGHEGQDTLFGDEGDDFLFGDSDGQDPGIGANDFLDGGEGNDQLLGDGGDDQLFGGAGNDLILGDTDLDPQISGADVLFGEAGDDHLYGGPGLDLLYGGIGSDAYLLNLGDGQDEIFEEDVIGDVNTIIFGPGITFEMLTFVQDAAQQTLLIQAGAGGDSMLVHGFTKNGVNGTGGIQHLSVEGLAYSLTTLFGLPSGNIVGTFGNDIIETGNANDTVMAGDGHDTITANGGDDLLAGGAGNDTYIFNFGDGVDSIIDTVTPTEGNRILFGAGITAANLTYTQSVNTLTIAYNGSADAVQLIGFDENTVLGSLVVSTIQFDDGSVVNLADLFPPFTNHLPTVTNSIADQPAPEDTPWTFAVPENTFADEDAGDVLTYSASLADGTSLPGWLAFDAGTRTFSGTPDDAQVGTIGLRVTAADGRNAIVSDTFNLAVTNVNEAPTVAAPLADQAATKDILFEFVVPTGAFVDVDPGDTLVYSATLADNSALPSWLTFNPSTRTFSGTPQLTDVGTLTVKVTATDTGSLSAADVFTLTVAHGLNEIIGTPADESLTGTAGNDLIRGLGGNDTLNGLDGNDTLEGGDGDDTLYGMDGNDTLDGGAGNDLLNAGTSGGTGGNILRGGAGSDRLEGYGGNETFQGGSGNDTFYDSYGGQDVYLFDRGDGQDIIYADHGTIRFAAGVLPTDVTLRGSSDYSMVLGINGTSDQISFFNWLNPFVGYRVDRVEFSEGTVWDAATLRAMASTGTAGDDYVGGTNGNDVLIGLGGNDLLQAWDGDDMLDGGPGNDILRGNFSNFGGNDIFIFGRGYGFDLIQAATGTQDILQFVGGVLPSDVSLLRNGVDLYLSIDQSATQVRISTYPMIEQIVFNDGTIWDTAAITSHTFIGTTNSITGTTGNDTFVVDNTLDTVTEAANQGTDTIQSLVSYTLPDNVENLTLTSYFNVDGTGNLLSNVIVGNSGNNTLTGSVNDYNGGGSDTLQGGAGDDTYTVVGNADLVIEAANEGIDSITLIGDANRGWNYSLPDNVENLTASGAAWVFPGQNRNFFGNALSNVINGDPQWFNYIDGGLGADRMTGGTFSDTYVVDDPGDTVSDPGVSTDTVLSSVSYILGANLENLTLTGTAAINAIGNALNNVLTGNSAANILTGGAGNDTYVIGIGDTIVELTGGGTDTVSTDATYTLSADLENITLTGTAPINATGNALDNVLTGNSAANVLDGGAGADQLIGGGGDDTYLVGAGDTIVEQPFSGFDTVFADQTFTLSNDLENLTLTGAAAINGTGNALDNVLTGNSGANVLAGGAGSDTYVVDGGDTVVESAGEGIDTVQTSVTWVLANDLENLNLTGSNPINGTGNALDNVLTGNSAANVLTGGAGNDTYVVDSADTIIELANQGTDTVLSSVTFILAPDLENLTLTGAAAINGTGNAQNNVLLGNTGANVLDGGAGADTMFGDAGDDAYVVDNAGDTVSENASAGTDTVQSSVTYTLGADVENLTLTGTAAINGTGNSLANVLTGNSAANTLAGGVGNDIYVVGAGDTVTESSGQGTDTVQSSVTWTLGSNLENLTLTGTSAINGTGNTLNNQLVGNSGANVLTGGTGNDAMSGGAGDDTYVVDVAGDVVTELTNEGTDTVQSAITYTLGANLENLTLTGSSAINGTGNTLDNILTGNSAANVLTGGTGNDTYVVGTSDTVTEQASAGTDTVQSSITWTLGSNLENLTLTGTSAINGTGNTLNNVLTGNSGVNVLTGGTGNDTYVVGTGDSIVENASAGTDTVQSSITWTLGSNLENLTLVGSSVINGTGNASNNALAGNSANNILTGLGGNDTYQYSRGGGQDTVVDNSGTTDVMLFGTTINPLDLVLSRQANDLRLAIHGSTDQVTIQNWYSGTTNQTETIQAGNGQTLLNTQVDQLIQAMAGFTAQTGLTWDQGIDQQPAQVQSILAASWQ